MTRSEAYKTLIAAQKYLKYQDKQKFPLKAKKHMPIETLRALAALEAALQVNYKLCPVKDVVREMESLKQHDHTSRGRLIDDTIDKCIRKFTEIIKNGVDV